MLWYDVYLATYNRDLQAGDHHDLWLLGSSYMMTGLNPALVQQTLETAGLEGVSVQNYGLNRLQNLEVMGEVFDRWLFQLDEPQYVVLAIGVGNFRAIPRELVAIVNSTLERMLIFPTTLEDYTARFLYQHSALVHQGILLRYVLDPRDVAERGYFMDQVLPLGGYVEATSTYVPENCDLSQIDASVDIEANWGPGRRAANQTMLETSLADMDSFSAAIQARGIPLAMVIIPDQACLVRNLYGSYAEYDALFREPVLAHVQAQGIPILDLTVRFRAEILPLNRPIIIATSAMPT